MLIECERPKCSELRKEWHVDLLIVKARCETKHVTPNGVWGIRAAPCYKHCTPSGVVSEVRLGLDELQTRSQQFASKSDFARCIIPASDSDSPSHKS